MEHKNGKKFFYSNEYIISVHFVPREREREEATIKNRIKFGDELCNTVSVLSLRGISSSIGVTIYGKNESVKIFSLNRIIKMLLMGAIYHNDGRVVSIYITQSVKFTMLSLNDCWCVVYT